MFVDLFSDIFSDTESYFSFEGTTDFIKNIEYELYLEKCSNETSIHDKEIYVFDYDDTLRLHTIKEKERQIYEDKLYSFMVYLKNQNKKIYLVSYNLNPFKSSLTKSFNERFKKLFDGLVYPQPIEYDEFQNSDVKYDYTYMSGYFYVYTPKYLDILDIAKKHNVPTNQIVFFDDNRHQIELARKANIPSIHVSIKFGIPLH